MSFSTNETYTNQTVLHITNTFVHPDTLKVKYAYFITSSIGFIVFIIFLLTYLKDSSNEPHPTRASKIKNKNLREKPNQNLSSIKHKFIKLEDVLETEGLSEKKTKQIKRFHKYVLVILGCIFMHLIYGIELSFGTLLPAFAVKSDLRLSKASASYVSSLYWGCFTFSRLFTIIVVNYLKPKTVLILELILIMLGNVFLLPFGGVYEWALILGSVFLGFGVSSAYPSWWGFMEKIIPTTSKITSLVTFSSCLGEFILPVLIGNYIETWPMVYIYVVFGYSLLSCIAFAICCFWENVINKYKDSP